MKRGYIDGPYGQVHLLDTTGPAGSGAPPLVCLHATAYSSRSLRPLVAALGAGRRVLALDTPGYGGSDGPPGRVAIEDYADALADSIARLSPGVPVDVFGYHTGITVAVEAALRHPGLVRRIVMIGVPLFVGPERDAWRRRLVVEHALSDGLEQFDERWRYLVRERPDGMSLADGFANFVDELRAWPNGWWAHAALFEHDLSKRLPLLDLPVLVINPASALAGESRAAAALLRQTILVEMPEISGAIFAGHAHAIAEPMRAFLDND